MWWASKRFPVFPSPAQREKEGPVAKRWEGEGGERSEPCGAGGGFPRRLALAVPLALVAACGLRPLYGVNSAGVRAADQLASVDVEVIADRPGQILRTALIQKLNPRGRTADPAYHLAVTLSEVKQDINIINDLSNSRTNLTITATYSLTDSATREIVFADRVSETTSYNILLDQFTTEAGERDARERALTQLGDDIRTRLALYFDRAAT